MNETLTIEQALTLTIGIMKDINVPAAYVEQIGIPLAKCINNLDQCVIAIKKSNDESGANEDGRETDSE